MKVELNLVKLSESTTETADSVKKYYTASFKSDNGMSLSVSKDTPFDFVVGDDYTIKFDTEQKKL